jgi:hypothetical protein
MARNRQEREPIPAHFGTIDEAAEFWDTHDLADYWDLTEEVADVEVDLQQRRYLFALAPNLVRKVVHVAHEQGVSAETLVNVWLTEKLQEATPARQR